MNKNFLSKTEHEETNQKKLKLLSIGGIDNDFVCTYEETCQNNTYLLSYLKFWRLEFKGEREKEYIMTQICSAQNPHNGKIKEIINLEEIFITIGDESNNFKIWRQNSKDGKLTNT